MKPISYSHNSYILKSKFKYILFTCDTTTKSKLNKTFAYGISITALTIKKSYIVSNIHQAKWQIKLKNT